MSFVQYLLSEDQLRAGLLKVVDPVDIPDEPLAVLQRTASELEETLGLRFQATFDDLDETRIALLKIADGSVVVMKDYSPSPGVNLYTRMEESFSAAFLDRVTGLLGLSPDDVAWSRPAARALDVNERAGGRPRPPGQC